MSITIETIIESVRSRPRASPRAPEEYLSVLKSLERGAQLAQERKQAHARAHELAARQGVRPIQIEDLRGDFRPEDDVDEFLSWVHSIREQDKDRSRIE